MSTASYVVNIIYVRDTVERLLPFCRSLLDHTECRYRLVSNGCTAAERALLAELTEQHPERIEHVVGSSDDVLPHGAMLQRLLADETEPYFVVADSDLIGVEPTGFDGLLPSPDEGVRCSALPVWNTAADTVAGQGFRVLSGRYIQVSGSDVVVGCSYAAAYHTERLRSIVERWRAPLEVVRWDELPRPLRAELETLGLTFEVYDTLKIVNLLHHIEGWPVRVVDIPGIVHVGALSQRRSERDPPRTRWGRMKRRVLRAVPSLVVIRYRQQGMSWSETRVNLRYQRRRSETRRFVERLARCEVGIEDAPPWLRSATVARVLANLYAPESIETGS